MRKYLTKLFYSDKWNIGYTHQTAKRFIEQRGFDSNITWLRESRADYSADPFAILHNSIVYIYYEELKSVLSKGRINVLKGYDFETKVRVEGFNPPNIHLSYPYIFTNNNVIYCIPETAKAKEVSLFEVDPLQMNKVSKLRVLLEGKSFVDSSIIFYNERFWLFTSVNGGTNVFYIYHASTLDEEFVPHTKNPILNTDKNFRGAGNLFIVEGRLYRPTQNIGIRYGGSVNINEITKLTESEFEHINLFEVGPIAPYYKGLHNLSFLGDTIVLDGKRSYFSLFVGLKKIIRNFLHS
jgi:hypothetical protein